MSGQNPHSDGMSGNFMSKTGHFRTFPHCLTNNLTSVRLLPQNKPYHSLSKRLGVEHEAKDERTVSSRAAKALH
jgi:hypothetical protein